jgi:hypothetical protein
MSGLRDKVTKFLAILPAILLVTFANVFISFTVAAVVMLQLITSGHNKYLALGVAVLVAVVTHFYIVFNHKIRDYIKQGERQ